MSKNPTDLVSIDNLDPVRTRKRIGWSTLNYFIDTDAVKIIILLSIPIYLLIFFIPIKYPDTSIFIPSLAELVSVFIGITLGFYWNKADETKKNSREYRIIFQRFIEELEENSKRLPFLYGDRYKNNLVLLLKHNTWDIGKEKLRYLNVNEIYEIEDIYYKINIINNHILRYPYIKDIQREDRDYLIGIIDTTQKNIEKWIFKIKSIYGWS